MLKPSTMNQVEAIFEPGVNDVICGRGAAITRHPGNIMFRKIVKEYLNDYTICSTNYKKMLMVKEIMTKVRNSNARFIAKDPKTKLWHDIGERRAMRKKSQALRDHFVKREQIKNDEKAMVISSNSIDFDENDESDNVSINSLDLNECGKNSLVLNMERHFKSSYGGLDLSLEDTTGFSSMELSCSVGSFSSEDYFNSSDSSYSSHLNSIILQVKQQFELEESSNMSLMELEHSCGSFTLEESNWHGALVA